MIFNNILHIFNTETKIFVEVIEMEADSNVLFDIQTFKSLL